MRLGDFSQSDPCQRPAHRRPFQANLPAPRSTPSCEHARILSLPTKHICVGEQLLAVNKNTPTRTNQRPHHFTEAPSRAGTALRLDHEGRSRWIYLTRPRGHQSATALIDNTRVLSASLVNEMRFGYNRFFNNAGTELNNVMDPIAAVGLSLPTKVPPDAWGLPNIGIAGFSGFGPDSNSPYINSNQNWQFTENLSWNRGSHFVKTGADLRLDHYNQDGNQFARGSAGFNANVATGNGFADYMLGYIGTWSYASGLAVARLTAFSQSYYVTDTWKLRPNLTLNYGLRYEYTPPWTDTAERQIVAVIPINTQQPQVADLSLHPVLVRAGTGDFYENAGIRFAPGIQVARDGRLGKTLIDADKTNFAPRLGAAWSITAKTVLRAGVGRFYVQDIGNISFDMNRNLQGRLTVQSTATNLISTWNDPFNFGAGNS